MILAKSVASKVSGIYFHSSNPGFFKFTFSTDRSNILDFFNRGGFASLKNQYSRFTKNKKAQSIEKGFFRFGYLCIFALQTESHE